MCGKFLDANVLKVLTKQLLKIGLQKIMLYWSFNTFVSGILLIIIFCVTQSVNPLPTSLTREPPSASIRQHVRRDSFQNVSFLLLLTMHKHSDFLQRKVGAATYKVHFQSDFSCGSFSLSMC